MKKIMAVLAAGIVFIALAMTSCSDPIAVEEGPTVTIYFGGNSASRAADDDHAVYPYTPIGGDGSFHKKITYKVEFYEKETDIGQDHGGNPPAYTGTTPGGTEVKVNLKSHGIYNIYVSAYLGSDLYAELHGARGGVDIGWGGGGGSAGNSYHYLTIDTTKTSSLTVVMKVVNPVFWDASNFEAITAYMYTVDNDVSNEGKTIRMAVELSPANWAGILNAISIGSLPQYNLVDLDLSHCTTPNGVFDPTPGASAGKAKINKITLPLDATSIAPWSGEPTFNGFSALTEVNAPSVTSVGPHAFEGCTALKTLSFPEATIIGEQAFKDCTSLKVVSFRKANNISQWAFFYSSVATVDLPAATIIGDHAFQNLTDLAEVNLPNATSIGDYAFENCNNLPTVVLHKVTIIGDNAFAYCHNLETMELPNATEIGAVAFNSTNLETVELPNAMLIGREAFGYCVNLTSLKIPKMKKIGYGAFDNTGTKDLNIYLGSTPPNLGTELFYDVSSSKTVNVYVLGDPTAYGYGSLDTAHPLGSDGDGWLHGLAGSGWDPTIGDNINTSLINIYINASIAKNP